MAFSMPTTTLLSLISLAAYALFCLMLFVICISFFGISTGIRRIYVNMLLSIFEWAAKLEKEKWRDEESESGSGGESEEHSAASSASPSRGTSPPPSAELLAKRRNTKGDQTIILRKWSMQIENKLVGVVDERNTHPLAQYGECGRKRRVASYARDLKQLADQNSAAEIGDAEYATMKVMVNDTLELLSAGIEAIIEDEVTHRFEAAQLPTWNFLSRNRKQGLKISWQSQCIWAAGVLVRYLFLFPIRLTLFCISTALFIVLTGLIGCIPNERVRSALYRPVMLSCMRTCARTFSTIVTFHDVQNRPRHGICVANHTSPIDVNILSTDNCYAMVGQRHGGVLGIVQMALERAEHHLWFERTESRDREGVAKTLREHVQCEDKLPILIFPEGTCINNTSVMLFKKGSFEVASSVCPIAMKYDNRLGDPFWNSHEKGYLAYLIGMMTAWALICDVWYLPPMHRKEGESAIEFARRCQRSIARAGGLVDLGWDGNLKRQRVPERLKDEQRELFFHYLAETTPICECGRPSSGQMEHLRKEIHPEVYDGVRGEAEQTNEECDGRTAAEGSANCATQQQQLGVTSSV